MKCCRLAQGQQDCTLLKDRRRRLPYKAGQQGKWREIGCTRRLLGLSIPLRWRVPWSFQGLQARRMSESQYKVIWMQAGPNQPPFKFQGQNATFFSNLHQELLPTALMQNSNTSRYAFPLQFQGNWPQGATDLLPTQPAGASYPAQLLFK